MKVVAAFLLVLCHLAVSHGNGNRTSIHSRPIIRPRGWNCVEGPRLYNVQQIDAGLGKVVVTTRQYYAYFLIGSSWHRLTTMRLRHITVGPAGMWASGYRNRVYKYVYGMFKRSNGLSLKQVDAGGDDHVVGVNPSNLAYCLRESRAMYYSGSGSLSWNYLSRRLKYYSCGPNYGCWGVDTRNYIYVAKSVNPASCSTSNWSRVAGRLKMVEVGTDGKVFGVSTSGQVFQRTGITRTRQQGLRWVQVPMCSRIQHVSYDLGTLWAVTTSGLVMKCT